MPGRVEPSQVEERLERLERAVRTLERAKRLPTSSIHDGALKVFDVLDVERARVGKLADGSFGMDVDGGKLRAIDVDGRDDAVSNVSLSSGSVSVKVSASITPPSWALKATVWAAMSFQMSETQGSAKLMMFRVDIEGAPGSGAQNHGIEANQVQHVERTASRHLTTLAPPVLVQGLVGISTGANASNQVRLDVIVLWLR